MKVTFNTGNFAITVDGEYNSESQAKALENALRYELQRDVATKVYVAVAGEGEGEKKKLPKDFERSSVEYSDDAALEFQAAAEKELSKRGTFEVSVAKYEGSEAASPMKRATTLVDTFLGSPMEAGYRAILGLPEGDREALIAKANEMGLGIQPPKAKKEATETSEE